MNEHTSQGPLSGTPAGQPMTSSASGPGSGGMKEAASTAKEKIKAKAGELGSQAKERGEQMFTERKERAAGRIEGYSESMHETAERFEREQDPNIAHYTHLVAEKLERAAGYVRERSFQDLRRDAEDIARRHPAVFFGGMFVAGLALARFAKASADRSEFESYEPQQEASTEYAGTAEVGAPSMPIHAGEPAPVL